MDNNTRDHQDDENAADANGVIDRSHYQKQKQQQQHHVLPQETITPHDAATIKVLSNYHQPPPLKLPQQFHHRSPQNYQLHQNDAKSNHIIEPHQKPQQQQQERIQPPSIPRFSSDRTPPIVMKRLLSSTNTLSRYPLHSQEQQHHRQLHRHQNDYQPHRHALQKHESLALSNNFSFIGVTSVRSAVATFHVGKEITTSSLRNASLSSKPQNKNRAATSISPCLSQRNEFSEERQEKEEGSIFSRVAVQRKFVVGIPNYGQTCFLNSVLQALASLESFTCYLTEVLKCNARDYEDPKDLHRGKQSHTEFGSMDRWYATSESSKSPSPSRLWLCREILHLLHSINGQPYVNDDSSHGSGIRNHTIQATGSSSCDNGNIHHHNKTSHKIDPRNLLRSVSEVHSQFGIGTRPGAQYYRRHGVLGSEQQDAQEFLQALLSMVVDDSSIPKIPSVLSSFPLENVHKSCYEITTPASYSRRRRLPCDDSFSFRGNTKNDVGESYKEEKKNEVTPATPSITALWLSDSTSEFHKESTVHEYPVTNPFGQTSAAVRRMLKTTSSINPSPFSGWIGSALQCRSCRNVRPIHNTLFVDLPVVPSHVSNYLYHRLTSVSATFRPTDSEPPCTLESCLKDFTSVERVCDVECRSCTHVREITLLEDEELMLQGGIESLESKAMKRDVNYLNELKLKASELTHDPVPHLRRELEVVQAKLVALRAISPDDDGAMESVLAIDESNVIETIEGPGEGCDGIAKLNSPLQLYRSDAFKCLLLTRLPSVLCIHIQRRFYDPETHRTTKTAQHVIFPEYLDVGPFCAYGSPDTMWSGSISSSSSLSRGDQPVSRVRLPEKRSSVLYKLMSVIEHHGSAFFGHYVSYRRDPSSSSSSSSSRDQQWLYISDDKVMNVDWEVVKTCQAYLLFYEAC